MEPLSFEPSGPEAQSSAITSAITHRVRRDARLVHVSVAGDVTVSALHAARDGILADPDYAPGMHFLVECRVITSVPPADEIRTLALTALLNHADKFTGRVAIVAMTARSYEAASLFELFIDAPHRLALFTEPSHARAWLAVDNLTSF